MLGKPVRAKGDESKLQVWNSESRTVQEGRDEDAQERYDAYNACDRHQLHRLARRQCSC